MRSLAHIEPSRLAMPFWYDFHLILVKFFLNCSYFIRIPILFAILLAKSYRSYFPNLNPLSSLRPRSATRLPTYPTSTFAPSSNCNSLNEMYASSSRNTNTTQHTAHHNIPRNISTNDNNHPTHSTSASTSATS